MKIDIPCMVGDRVWGCQRNKNGYFPRYGVVSKMMLEKINKNDTEPTLIITIRGVCRGEWGKNVFSSRTECDAECKMKNTTEKESD